MSAPVDHPPPWKWETEREGFTLRDANGSDVIPTIVGSGYCDPDPADRALIAAAPEMETLLRQIEWSAYGGGASDYCPFCRNRENAGHGVGCDLAALFARLDEARRG